MYSHNSSSSSAKRQLIMEIETESTRLPRHSGITTRAQWNLSSIGSNEDQLLNRGSYFSGDETGGSAILGLGSLCQSPPSSPLKLNFNYGNRSHDSALESSVLSSSSSAASTASDGTERPVSFNMQYFMQHLRDKRTDFRKFIPVPFSCLKMPVIPLDEHDSKEYGEAEEAFSDSLPHTSRSETSVPKGSSARNSGSKRHKILKMFNCKKSLSISPQADRDFNYRPSYQLDHPTPSKLPKPSDNRFDFETNDAHCKLIAFSKSDQDEFSVSLYVELPKIPNHYLCHVQTELAVAAMKSYFGSLEEQALIELLWVSDIQKQLDHLKTGTKSKFSGIEHIKNVECIMVVSEKASILLRHSKLAFLHSVAAILQTNPRKTLILVKDGWWIPTIPELEVETPKEPSFWSALWSRW